MHTADKPTGGLRRLAEMHALLPRLGQFIGNEEQVPYDYGELLEAIAPSNVARGPLTEGARERAPRPACPRLATPTRAHRHTHTPHTASQRVSIRTRLCFVTDTA